MTPQTDQEPGTASWGELEDHITAQIRALLSTCPACADRRHRVARARRQAADLTPRRRQVLALVAEGLTNDQIARRLGVARSTIHTHLDLLYQAFDVHSRAELVAKAFRAGVIE